MPNSPLVNFIGAATVVGVVAAALALAHRPSASQTPVKKRVQAAALISTEPAPLSPPKPEPDYWTVTVHTQDGTIVDHAYTVDDEFALQGAALVESKRTDVMRIKRVQVSASQDLRNFERLTNSIHGNIENAEEIVKCGFRSSDWLRTLEGKQLAVEANDPELGELRARLSPDEIKAAEGQMRFEVASLQQMNLAVNGNPTEKFCSMIANVPFLHLYDSYVAGQSESIPITGRN